MGLIVCSYRNCCSFGPAWCKVGEGDGYREETQVPGVKSRAGDEKLGKELGVNAAGGLGLVAASPELLSCLQPQGHLPGVQPVVFVGLQGITSRNRWDDDKHLIRVNVSKGKSSQRSEKQKQVGQENYSSPVSWVACRVQRKIPPPI